MSDSVQQEIFKIISGHAPEVDSSALTPDSKLQDLGIDSLDAIEIIFDIEEHFDIHLPDKDPNFDTNTMRGLIDAVTSMLAAKSGGTPALA